MRLSISNIAWPNDNTAEMLKFIKDHGCDSVEIAPSRIWAEPVKSSKKQRNDLLNLVKDNGLTICSLHSLLFSRPDLGIFKDDATVEETIDYFKELISLAKDLKIKVMIYGSPKSRNKGDLPHKEALAKAAKVFTKVAEYAEEAQVFFLIEPLSRSFTDFINTTAEAMQLVNLVNKPFFQLHLDSFALSEEKDYAGVLKEYLPYAKHFHVNNPDIGEVGPKAHYHEIMSKILKEKKYNGVISIEMRTLPNFQQAVEKSLKYVKQTYID
ncbi:sugar phosphate isomerase/epimerase family protein [Candidatus Margulisiibacteriota bacterium]